VDATMGQLVYLPTGVAGPDPDAFLSDVLTGWRRARGVRNLAHTTVRAYQTDVKLFLDCQWTAGTAHGRT